MITLIFTLRSANKRELNGWRRDTLLRLTSEALANVQDAEAFCASVIGQESAESPDVNRESAPTPTARMRTITEQLRMMGDVDLAVACRELKTATDDFITCAINAQTSRTRLKARQAEVLARLKKEAPDQESPVAEQKLYFARLGEALQRVDDGSTYEAAEKYPLAQLRMEGKRAAFIEQGQLAISATGKSLLNFRA